jgi:hypothetical protein
LWKPIFYILFLQIQQYLRLQQLTFFFNFPTSFAASKYSRDI